MKDLNQSGLTVTADKVLVRMFKIEEKTSGGIILAAKTQDKEQMAQQLGTVIDMGSAARAADEMEGIEVGDTVLLHRYSGQSFPVGGVDYQVFKAAQILGKCTKLPDYVLKGATSTLEEFGTTEIAA